MRRAGQLALRISRLFLGPEDERVYAAVRIGFAGAALYHLVLIWPYREVMFAKSGSVDIQTAIDFSPVGSVFAFQMVQSPEAVSVLLVIVGVSLVALMAGFMPRVAAAVVFWWHLSYLERSPPMLAGWDRVLRAFSFLVLISPMGHRWSLPAWMGAAKRVPAQVARYGLVLMRLQVLVIYFQSVLLKVMNINPYWRTGEFLSYYLLSHNARWPGAWAARYAEVLQIGTYLTLAVELAIPVLLFVRRTRFWGALLGLLLHGGISVMSRNLEPFMITMMMTYLAFLQTEDVERLEGWITGKAARASGS